MPNSFVAIDFETAIGHHICSVGLVTIINGEITEEFHCLIQPPNNDYNFHNINVHGITPFKTKNAPFFYEVYPNIKKRLQGKKVVAHNESFDRNVLIKSMRDDGLDYTELNISEKWECTLQIYRRKGYQPANLSSCCKAHQIDLVHHDALSDARACAKLYLLQL